MAVVIAVAMAVTDFTGSTIGAIGVVVAGTVVVAGAEVVVDAPEETVVSTIADATLGDSTVVVIFRVSSVVLLGLGIETGSSVLAS